MNVRRTYDPEWLGFDFPNLLPNLEEDPVGREKALHLQAEEVAAEGEGSGVVQWIVPVSDPDDREWLNRLEAALSMSTDPRFEVIVWGGVGTELSALGEKVRYSGVPTLGEIEIGRTRGWIGILPRGVVPQPETVGVIRRYVDAATSVHADFAIWKGGGGSTADPDKYSFYGYNCFGLAYLSATGAWEGCRGILGGLSPGDAAHGDTPLLQGAATGGTKVRIPLRLFVAGRGPEWARNPHWRGVLDRIARRDFSGRFLEERPRAAWEDDRPASVALIIPFRNQSGMTLGTLQSLSLQRGGWIRRVVLVNNRSDPAEAEQVKRGASGIFGEDAIVWIDDPGPFNFARLNNRGADRAGDCDLYWFSNNDIEIDDRGALGELCGLIALPEVGMVGGGLYYPDGSLQSAGIFEGPSGPQVARDPYGEYAESFREVNALTFASVLVRKTVWDQVGGLDEKVCPNGFGDALFGSRVRQGGWRILVDPAIRIRHLESPSRGKRPEAIERWQLARSGFQLGAFQESFTNGAQPFLRQADSRPPPALTKRVYRTVRAAVRTWKENGGKDNREPT